MKGLQKGFFVYTRPLKKVPAHIVQNGKINFGTFEGVTDTIDIRGVSSPFAGVPVAKYFSNFRIKSKLFFVFNIDNYIGLAEFFDDKAFGLAEVILWDTETNQKFAYHTFMGPRRRFVPIDTNHASCISFSKKRYIKIGWNRRRGKFSLSFTVKGDKYRPSSKCKFLARINENSDSEILTVCPAPNAQRCSATWIAPLNIEGGIAFGKHRHHIKEIPQHKGLGCLLLNRTYLKFLSYSELMFGFTNYQDKSIVFSFSSSNQESNDPDTYNDNMLSVDNSITAMPPVTITHPFGIQNKWVIQDTENMVDLNFSPISSNARTLNIIVMRNHYTTIYGTFEGVLLSKDGDKIVLKNCPGVIKKNSLRL